jgi:hypothetical protein
MHTKWKFLTFVALGFTLLSSPVSASTVDGISIIINKEPITLYDIHKYATRFNLSKKESLDILVRQKLEDSEIKKLGLSTDNFEVDQYIENLAISNNMSQYDFLNMLRSKNVDVNEYKEDLKSKLKRDKLYKKIISTKMQQLGDDELQTYYTQNQGEFSQASAFDVTIYTSAEQQALQNIAQSPMSPQSGVELKEAKFEADKVDPKLVQLLNKTAENSFSSMVRSEQNFVMFFVKKKYDVKTVSFEEAKNYIYGKLAQSKEQKAIEEYFEKLKASANIQVVRAP